jgi:phospholipid/cholesterol/gamma-HCH transport system substrate-binding protein
MMESEARYTLVGTFVVVLLALAAAAVVWLLRAGDRDDLATYRIYFARQSLEGLEVRSDVRMKGIRVGAVTGFSFAPQRPGTVEVVVSLLPATPVRESTRAIVDRNLVTGLATIRLLNLNEDAPPLKRVEGGSDPVIAEGESRLQQFSETINQLAERADETLSRINATLSGDNQKAIGDTLANLNGATRDLGRLLGRVDGAVVSIDQAADAIHSASATLTGDVHRLADRYDTLGAETAQNVKAITGTVTQLGADVSLLTRRTETLIADTNVELRQTTPHLRAAADSLAAASRKLGEPRAALLGPPDASLGPGEERQ